VLYMRVVEENPYVSDSVTRFVQVLH